MAGETPIAQYLRKQPCFRPSIEEPPAPDLGLVVAIPCKDEPALGETLASLARAAAPAIGVEVIVIANASERDDAEVRARSALDAREARAFGAAAAAAAAPIRVHVIEALDLPARHAGVGLARKLAMDEAALRLDRVGRPRGVIACLDADCTVAPSYLVALAEWFDAHPEADAAAVHFEHPHEDLADPRHRAAIVGYELFLRCHVHGLGLAGHPSAIQTVGSSMAVRAVAYATHGGMNRRQAGEDFYFLQKLALHARVGEIRSTTVHPSPRVSSRVPFGTGRAVGEALAREDPSIRGYDPRVYRVLAELIARIDRWWASTGDDPLAGLGEVAAPAASFLRDHGLPEALHEMRANATSLASFRARFFAWLSPFRALKLVHHLTAVAYPRQPIAEVALAILAWHGVALDLEPLARSDEEGLLSRFRALDRGDPTLPPSGRERP
ncbi:MAG: glycosyltransferase family A protein [bacterium]